MLTMHEFAHSYVAYKCGDPTPKFYKRLSLNPFRHFDPIGLVCFALIGFGWAKPVPINANNFRHYKRGLVLTSSAGVIMNYLTAFLSLPLYMVVWNYCPNIPVLTAFLESLTFFLFARSLSFCVFNLLPFYPLDGYNLISTVAKPWSKTVNFLRKYGYYILIGLIVESFLCNSLVDGGIYQADWFNLLGWIMKFATNIFGYPIVAFWNLIPWRTKLPWRVIPW